MHQVVLNVNDTVFNTFLYFVKNLPAKDVTIVSDEIIADMPDDSYETVLSELLEKRPFADVEDSVKWQKEQRDEW